MKEFVIDQDGPKLIEQTPNLDVTEDSISEERLGMELALAYIDKHPRDAEQPWESTCVGIQSATLEAPDQRAYDQRIGLHSKKYLTMLRPSDALWIIDRVRERITGKVVVEIGAGIGVLAVALAGYAKHVYAIEADPMWTWAFSRHLYKSKPRNLTFILDAAENLVDVIKGDVAIVVTGSDEVNLRALAERFAPDVVMPWQDWNGGKAVTRWGHW